MKKEIMLVLHKKLYLVAFLLIGVLLITFVFAAPTFHTSGTTSYLEEERSPVFSYNFTSNVTNPENDTLTFSFQEIKSNLYPNQNSSSFYYWISLNSTTGVMTINSTRDNETGRFNISVNVLNTVPEGETRSFYFVVNATNDAPNFTNIDAEYNLSQDQSFTSYINATDEENHHPLFFNITFLANCTHATWSDRTNCTLFTLTNVSNTSAIMNFTPVKNDVGTYYANISVRDYGQNYTCNSTYCATNYSSNRTSYYSRIVVFNLLSNLEINITDCQNRLFQENVSNACKINITTKGQADSINVSSVAFLRNAGGTTVSNNSWFYVTNQTTTINFTRTININVTPRKTEVGNWTINFTVNDLTYSTNLTEQIFIYVNRTYNDLPEIATINNRNTSINLLTRINLTVYDDDLLISDKNNSFGGYNETTNFSRAILNQSNLSQTLSITNFNIEILNMPVSLTNRTEAKIEFTPNSSEAGYYTINITINDRDGSRNFTTFNLSIINNNAPLWNDTLARVLVIYENNSTYFNFSKNATDPDGDTITFSFTNDTSFPGFNLNATTGVVNFTPIDRDVGQHLVNITISDGYLTNTTTFNFTIYNINDAPDIETPISATNASADSNSNINATEDNLTTLTLWIQDDDFKIPSGQRSFYNETFSINLTIQGPNSSLFRFAIDSSFPTTGNNRSKFDAIFTPKRADIGRYNITINVSDVSNVSDILRFNLTINSIEYNPVLISLNNQTSAINRSFYYQINATDIEDGSSNITGNTNFTFRYSFINGTDFINNNQSRFNITTGKLNITFNNSQGGIYRLNITVNDSAGKEDSENFWINVYDIPIVNSPASSYEFNLSENQRFNFSFQVNHSIRNNLSYLAYIKYADATFILSNTTYYGNNTNFTFNITFNFTQETSTKINLTLVAYPTDSELTNNFDLNVTTRWNITINHANAPVVSKGHIGDRQVTYDNNILINLSNFFSDIDYNDVKYNQTINFTVNSNSSSRNITASISNWMLTLSSTTAVMELLNITATDLNDSNSSLTNSTSNNFLVEFTTPSTTPSASTGSGGGGGSTSPIAFKIIVPGKISLYSNEKITIPLTLTNKGKRDFRNIRLSSEAYKDSKTINFIETYFDKDYIPLLKVGESENLTFTMIVNTNKTGDYEILINATSKEPRYTDWTKIYIDLQGLNETKIKKYILFTEEFIVQNPECIELQEILDEAKKYFAKGEYSEARLKAEEVVNACEEFISQVSLPELKFPPQYTFSRLLILVSLGSFLLGVLYYYFKRKRLGRMNA